MISRTPVGNEKLTLCAPPFSNGGGFNDADIQTYAQRRCEEIPHGNSGAGCGRRGGESRLLLRYIEVADIEC